MQHFFLTVLAEDASSQGGGLDMFVMIGMIFLIFWFLVIRPGSKERKQREVAVKALKKHDKVVTNAGIHGTVMILEDENVVLRVDDKNNVRIRFSRAAIWQVLGDETASKSDSGKKDSGKKDSGKGTKKGANAKAYESKAKADAEADDSTSEDPKATAETTAS